MTDELWERIEVLSETKNLRRVRAFILEALSRRGLVLPERNKVVLAVDEVVANVMEHGYGPDEPGPISVALRVEERRVEVEVRDRGRPFDPRQLPEPDLLSHIRQGRNRGLGWYLIRRIMDEVDYRAYDGEGNVLQMSRSIDPAPPNSRNP